MTVPYSDWLTLLQRVDDLETRLARAHNRVHKQKRRAELWRLRWQHASGRSAR